MENTLNDKQVKIQPLDHLGLVSATIEKLKLVEKIDKRLPVAKNKGAKVTMGNRVKAMILNGLGFIDDRLYMFPEFLEKKPVDRLFSDNLKANDFNDDVIGRCLDEIYDYGVTKLFSELAFEVGAENNLLGKAANFDTSTISVYGEYDNGNNEASTENNSASKKPIEITRGFSKDKRFDLKQMVINLATTGASGFPIWMEAHSGNASDKTIIQEAAQRMKNFCQQLKDAPSFLFVGDSAMYENCVKKAGNFTWLSRVPETIGDAKKIISQADSDFSWIQMPDGYRITAMQSNYGNVPQRWLLVFSQQAYEREIKTFDKKIEKEKAEFEKTLWHLSNQSFACEKDARKQAEAEVKKLKYHRVIGWEISTAAKHDKKGRPVKNSAAKKTEYFIAGSLEQDMEKIELARRAKGRFILATNELDNSKLSDEQMLPEYKEQAKTESGFRFIKGNAMEVSSVFLKKESRIEALMMIMTLCLMVYSFAQYFLRVALQKNNETVPNQLKKPTQTPTMNWIYRMFYGVGIVIVDFGSHTETIVANLKEVTRRIVSYFGTYAEKIYGLY